jgi:5'-deoxynucleotidase
MRNIKRWNLMRSVSCENLLEHSAQVAQIAHALAVINNKIFGGTINPERVTVLALYHDSSEVITGDLPTPVKYYNNDIKQAYKNIEVVANYRLLGMLPKEIKSEFAPLLIQDTDDYENKIVKAADKLSAYIKCIEELKSGNNEFSKAYKSTLALLEKNMLPEIKYFLDNFIKGFELTLDELD